MIRIAIIIACCLHYGSVLSFAGALLYDGEVHYQHFVSTDSKGETQVSKFQAWVEGCKWLIRIRSAKESMVERNVEVACDGSSVYLNRCTHVPSHIATNSSPLCFGLVLGRAIPSFVDAHEAGVIWLALASSCVLSNVLSGERVEPCISLSANAEMDYDPFDSLKLKTTYRLHGEAGFLVEHLVYFNDGFAKSPVPGVFGVKFKMPYDTLYTNSVYDAIEITNCLNMLHVKKAVLETFVRNPRDLGTGKLDLVVAHRYLIAVSGISLSSMPRIPPAVCHPTRVFDFRFLNAAAFRGPASYVANEHQLELDEARKMLSTGEGPR